MEERPHPRIPLRPVHPRAGQRRQRGLLDLVAQGELHPKVAQVLPLEKAAEAQRLLAESGPFGRILLAL
ncbi:zinc-binding dehydrogenase [Microbispora sp. SCL1-1]|uniref:zinc-binding dehydrogenase n=1 Tax=Microbispora TaxID=2005 RepID=UPI0037CA306E